MLNAFNPLINEGIGITNTPNINLLSTDEQSYVLTYG